jgi:L-serine dehydratase
LVGIKNTVRICIELYGSLALTGHGHGTDKAVLLGCIGFLPEAVNPDDVESLLNAIRTQQRLNLMNTHAVSFHEETDLLFHKGEFLPGHSNAMRFTAFDSQNETIDSRVYYSVGGGFIVEEGEPAVVLEDKASVPHLFTNAQSLLVLCERTGKSIAQLMLANECTWRSEQDVNAGILNIWHAMDASIDRGRSETGILPGGLNVKRRAAALYIKLLAAKKETGHADEMNWLNLYALAVNEENAAGGRIVTAPTNGAAGIIPAVLKYYTGFVPGAHEQGIIDFMLTAAAVGMLFKSGASISAAEVGCQGEVGVACSMAAAGLCAALGGTVEQVENAAEMGMEHNLGLTCDPVGGLVQIPCIERNAMGAVQAVNTAKLALLEEGEHYISLDTVIETMRQTGKDMQLKYKETSQGGLAVNVPEC